MNITKQQNMQPIMNIMIGYSYVVYSNIVDKLDIKYNSSYQIQKQQSKPIKNIKKTSIIYNKVINIIQTKWMSSSKSNMSNQSSRSNILTLSQDSSSSFCEQKSHTANIYYKKFISKLGFLFRIDTQDLDALYNKIVQCVNESEGFSASNDADISELIQLARKLKHNHNLLKNMVELLDMRFLQKSNMQETSYQSPLKNVKKQQTALPQVACNSQNSKSVESASKMIKKKFLINSIDSDQNQKVNQSPTKDEYTAIFSNTLKKAKEQMRRKKQIQQQNMNMNIKQQADQKNGSNSRYNTPGITQKSKYEQRVGRIFQQMNKIKGQLFKIQHQSINQSQNEENLQRFADVTFNNKGSKPMFTKQNIFPNLSFTENDTMSNTWRKTDNQFQNDGNRISQSELFEKNKFQTDESHQIFRKIQEDAYYLHDDRFQPQQIQPVSQKQQVSIPKLSLKDLYNRMGINPNINQKQAQNDVMNNMNHYVEDHNNVRIDQSQMGMIKQTSRQSGSIYQIQQMQQQRENQQKMDFKNYNKNGNGRNDQDNVDHDMLKQKQKSIENSTSMGNLTMQSSSHPTDKNYLFTQKQNEANYYQFNSYQNKNEHRMIDEQDNINDQIVPQASSQKSYSVSNGTIIDKLTSASNLQSKNADIQTKSLQKRTNTSIMQQPNFASNFNYAENYQQQIYINNKADTMGSIQTNAVQTEIQNRNGKSSSSQLPQKYRKSHFYADILSRNDKSREKINSYLSRLDERNNVLKSYISEMEKSLSKQKQNREQAAYSRKSSFSIANIKSLNNQAYTGNELIVPKFIPHSNSNSNLTIETMHNQNQNQNQNENPPTFQRKILNKTSSEQILKVNKYNQHQHQHQHHVNLKTEQTNLSSSAANVPLHYGERPVGNDSQKQMQINQFQLNQNHMVKMKKPVVPVLLQLRQNQEENSAKYQNINKQHKLHQQKNTKYDNQVSLKNTEQISKLNKNESQKTIKKQEQPQLSLQFQSKSKGLMSINHVMKSNNNNQHHNADFAYHPNIQQQQKDSFEVNSKKSLNSIEDRMQAHPSSPSKSPVGPSSDQHSSHQFTIPRLPHSLSLFQQTRNVESKIELSEDRGYKMKVPGEEIQKIKNRVNEMFKKIKSIRNDEDNLLKNIGILEQDPQNQQSANHSANQSGKDFNNSTNEDKDKKNSINQQKTEKQQKKKFELKTSPRNIKQFQLNTQINIENSSSAPKNVNKIDNVSPIRRDVWWQQNRNMPKSPVTNSNTLINQSSLIYQIKTPPKMIVATSASTATKTFSTNFNNSIGMTTTAKSDLNVFKNDYPINSSLIVDNGISNSNFNHGAPIRFSFMVDNDNKSSRQSSFHKNNTHLNVSNHESTLLKPHHSRQSSFSFKNRVSKNPQQSLRSSITNYNYSYSNNNSNRNSFAIPPPVAMTQSGSSSKQKRTHLNYNTNTIPNILPPKSNNSKIMPVLPTGAMNATIRKIVVNESQSRSPSRSQSHNSKSKLDNQNGHVYIKTRAYNPNLNVNPNATNENLLKNAPPLPPKMVNAQNKSVAIPSMSSLPFPPRYASNKSITLSKTDAQIGYQVPTMKNDAFSNPNRDITVPSTLSKIRSVQNINLNNSYVYTYSGNNINISGRNSNRNQLTSSIKVFSPPEEVAVRMPVTASIATASNHRPNSTSKQKHKPGIQTFSSHFKQEDSRVSALFDNRNGSSSKCERSHNASRSSSHSHRSSRSKKGIGVSLKQNKPTL